MLYTRSPDTVVNHASFCVVVHDVAPVYQSEIAQILDQTSILLGRHLAGALVPCWHGSSLGDAESQLVSDWKERFGELLLHGCTHFRETRPGLVSWLTGRSDEFAGLSSNESLQRVERAQSQVKVVLGDQLRGFLAPAWQFPAPLSAIQPSGIEYIMGFSQLVRIAAAPVRLATWSWDWGWLPGTGRTGAMLGALRHAWFADAIPTIVLHPMDVRRGHLGGACRLIRKFLRAGRSPVLPSEIAGCVTSGASV